MVAAQTNSKDKATADLLAQIEALRAENAKLKERNNARLSLTVSEKGCVFNLRPWTLPQQPEASGRGCSAWWTRSRLSSSRTRTSCRPRSRRCMGEQTKLAQPL